MLGGLALNGSGRNEEREKPRPLMDTLPPALKLEIMFLLCKVFVSINDFFTPFFFLSVARVFSLVTLQASATRSMVPRYLFEIAIRSAVGRLSPAGPGSSNSEEFYMISAIYAWCDCERGRNQNSVVKLAHLSDQLGSRRAGTNSPPQRS